MAQETLVRHYTGSSSSIRRQYEADQRRLAAQGYEVANQTVVPGRRGCPMTILGVLTLGILLIVMRPKDTMIVAYRRVSGGAPAS